MRCWTTSRGTHAWRDCPVGRTPSSVRFQLESARTWASKLRFSIGDQTTFLFIRHAASGTRCGGESGRSPRERGPHIRGATPSWRRIIGVTWQVVRSARTIGATRGDSASTQTGSSCAKSLAIGRLQLIRPRLFRPATGRRPSRIEAWNGSTRTGRSHRFPPLANHHPAIRSFRSEESRSGRRESKSNR